MAAKATAGRSTMPPITRAARIRSRKPKVDTLPPIGSPTTPARSHAPLKARRVATIQTTVWSRLTGMPRRAARSARSAEARTAMPTSVRRRNTARAIITSGATTRAASSSAPKMIGSTVNWMSQGRSRAWADGRSPQSRGSNRLQAPSRVARPMVATVRISRGASKKRRMTSSSTRAPTTRAASRPAPRDTQ